MSSNNPIQEVRVIAEDRSGIVTHPREIMDLKELFVILTYHCNGNCEYCIERNVINDKIKVTKKGKIKITKIGYFFD